MERETFEGRKYYKTTAGYYLSNKPYKYMHRDVWEHSNGEIPEKHHIHHKDGDKGNNSIDNLECVCGKKHISSHAKKRTGHLEKITIAAKEYQRSDIGRKSQSERSKRAWENRKKYIKSCLVCNTDYETFWPTKAKFCGERCKTINRKRIDF